ncbi:hypothetical protein U9M48_014082, partial [Paspalum notatum var. saurae]
YYKRQLIELIQEANQIQQYRPICLLNVSFKIFTKVATNRINSVTDHLNILEGGIILHETVHELHRKKQSGVIFKIDFKKAYAKVTWPFLLQTLQMKGFSPKWITLVQSFILGGIVAINLDLFSKPKKDCDWETPLSPILFNLVADMLATLIKCAKTDGQISGVVLQLVDGGLSIIHYVDDTILFTDHDLEKVCNKKLLLCAFEQLSRLKINFHKSEEAKPQYIEVFRCNPGSFPMMYLGTPIHYRKQSNADWRKVEERFKKGRITLINLVLSSLPMYMMSFLVIAKDFFWQCDDQKRKCRLAKWDILCQPKDQGGHEIHDLDIKNMALLT